MISVISPYLNSGWSPLTYIREVLWQNTAVFWKCMLHIFNSSISLSSWEHQTNIYPLQYLMQSSKHVQITQHLCMTYLCSCQIYIIGLSSLEFGTVHIKSMLRISGCKLQVEQPILCIVWADWINAQGHLTVLVSKSIIKSPTAPSVNTCNKE